MICFRPFLKITAKTKRVDVKIANKPFDDALDRSESLQSRGELIWQRASLRFAFVSDYFTFI